MIAVTSKLQIFRSLRHRNFRYYWFAGVWQSTARGMQFFLVAWLVLQLTDSASQVGLAVFLYGLPNLGLVIFGGVIADRVSRLKLLVYSQTLVGILILGLATLEIADLVALWHIYAIAFALGIIQGINIPSRIAVIFDLVDREDVLNAVALNSLLMNLGRTVGPVLAGGLIAIAGVGAAIYLNAGCYLVGVALLLFIKRVPSLGTPDRSSFMGDLWEGLRYLWTTPVALAIIVIGYAFGYAGGYLQVLPAHAKEVLGASANEAGLLLTAVGLGALLANLIIAALGDFRRKVWLLLANVLGFSLALLLIPWSTWFWVSAVILVFVGMGYMGYITMGTVILQLTMPRELLGRLMALWVLGASFEYLGALPIGVGADHLGWPASIIGATAVCLFFVVWLGLWTPHLRRLRV